MQGASLGLLGLLPRLGRTYREPLLLSNACQNWETLGETWSLISIVIDKQHGTNLKKLEGPGLRRMDCDRNVNSHIHQVLITILKVVLCQTNANR